MTCCALFGFVAAMSTAALPAWEFDDAESLKAWAPNAYVANATVTDGILRAETVDWDPFFNCRDIQFEATPWQFVVLRIKADQPGTGELFWSGSLEGKYGGLSQNKTTRFSVRGGDWQEVVLFPFWQREGSIRQLRLDLYDGAHFEIDWIRVLDWGGGVAPLTDVSTWSFDEQEADAWRIHPAALERFAPPLRLDTAEKGWITVRCSARQDAPASVLWATRETYGVQSEAFSIRGDGAVHTYDVEVQSYPSWGKEIVALGVRFPEEAGVELASVAVAEDPSGPPEITVTYFGFENALNRVGRRCRLLVQLENQGGSAGAPPTLRLALPDQVRIVQELSDAPDSIDYGEQAALTAEVTAQQPGRFDVALLQADKNGATQETAKATLRFHEAVDLPKADYVPEPQPVETSLDVCMYYFPGWPSDAPWDCIRRVAPIRKPLLGYYDESNPECVDWQIKWAVENGVSCFLVDWYWSAGHQHLTHWFEAYRKARYRDQLQVAIMWANHNAPNTHSRKDWRAVTQHWLERYFTLPAYYRIGGKPAVFLWAPANIRRDLGGSEAVRAAFDESQAMAREAGYDGIEFVAMHDHDSPAQVAHLLEEGYSGATTYHEWGQAPGLAEDPKRMRFEDVAATAPERWKERDERCGALTYYPVVDSGWDSRPWHGSKARVIAGRTPALFEDLLRNAKTYCAEHNKPFVVLGPANEWGEGSYIEPNTEFDFDLYEAVRRVFALGAPASWPLNIGPVDVERGPYDFPVAPSTTAWTFDERPEGWDGMMNVANLACADGCLVFTTTSADPALRVTTHGLRANPFSKAVIRMALEGPIPAGSAAQLFWSVGGAATSEATSTTIPLETDGAFHTYTLDLAAHPRWRGRISMLRFDPCSTHGVTGRIDHFAFEE